MPTAKRKTFATRSAGSSPLAHKIRTLVLPEQDDVVALMNKNLTIHDFEGIKTLYEKLDDDSKRVILDAANKVRKKKIASLEKVTKETFLFLTLAAIGHQTAAIGTLYITLHVFPWMFGIGFHELVLHATIFCWVCCIIFAMGLTLYIGLAKIFYRVFGSSIKPISGGSNDKRRSSSKFGGVHLSAIKGEDTNKLLTLALDYANAENAKQKKSRILLAEYKQELERQINSRKFLIRSSLGVLDDPIERIRSLFTVFSHSRTIMESLKHYFLAVAAHDYKGKAVRWNRWNGSIRLPPCIGNCVRSVMKPALELCNSFKRDLHEKYGSTQICAKEGPCSNILSAFDLFDARHRTVDEDMFEAMR